MEEDQAEWVSGPYNDDVDHDEEGAYGVEAIHRLIAALHANATMPTALQLVPQVLFTYFMNACPAAMLGTALSFFSEIR